MTSRRAVGLVVALVGCALVAFSTLGPPGTVALGTAKARYAVERGLHLVPAPVAADARRTSLTVAGWTRVVERGDQDLVDTCAVATLWAGPMPTARSRGTSVIVGHEYCGFDRFTALRVGDRVTVRGPDGLLRYRTYAKRFLDQRGVPVRPGMYRGDLTLQTCQGDQTVFTYLRRV